jgi:hypothetical protein
MKRKTEAELQRHKISKATRTLVRLKHSLAADEELNTVLPETLEMFDTALANGELKGLVAGLNDIIGG